jgi:hypothetical protein
VFHKSREFLTSLTQLGYRLGDREGGFESRQGLGFFLFTTASRPALGPTQPPIQWVPGALSLGVKLPGREAAHSPSSAEVKNTWSYISTPPLYLRGVVLSWSTGRQQKHDESLTTLPNYWSQWCYVTYLTNFTFSAEITLIYLTFPSCTCLQTFPAQGRPWQNSSRCTENLATGKQREYYAK